LTNLEAQVRTAVLAEVRPSSRRHRDRVERVTSTGEIDDTAEPVSFGGGGGDAELIQVLAWAIESGVPREEIALLCESQETVGRRATAELAAAHGISVRTLYRRRVRTLTLLRAAVEDSPTLAA
jgi:hypothetical protein